MATNRHDTLDPALLRPGRLDRKIEFPLPDRRQKRLIFQVRRSSPVTSQSLCSSFLCQLYCGLLGFLDHFGTRLTTACMTWGPPTSCREKFLPGNSCVVWESLLLLLLFRCVWLMLIQACLASSSVMFPEAKRSFLGFLQLHFTGADGYRCARTR